MEFAKEIERVLPNITRSDEPVRISGFHFESWDRLQQQLGVDRLDESCLFSDLSMGAWKGHWILHELCLQLGIDAYSYVQPLIGMEKEGEEYASVINRLIDNESIGDQNFLIAYESCKRILAEIQAKEIAWVLIVPPALGHSWEPENEILLRLLSQGLHGTSCQLGLLTFASAVVPGDWQVSHAYPLGDYLPSAGSFPVAGLLDAGLLPLLQDRIPASSLRLAGGQLLIPPSARGKEWTDPAFFANALREQGGAAHLRVVFELQQLTSASDIAFLQWEASRRFSEGGYGIALRILESIRAEMRDALKLAGVVSQIQNIRIALMYFSAAAEEAAPNEDLPEDYKASLYQSKAWGLVMTNRAQEAEPFFEKARSYLSKERFPRVYLYLLNISALNKLKTGELEQAFAFEKEIEATLAEQKAVDWHIRYINSINLARLYKKTGAYDLARTYYLTAFEVNNSLKVESDLLYANLCFAQLEERQENHKTAFIFWLRTCLHWLSNEAPEALAPRVAQAVLARVLSDRGGSVEAISAQLKQALLASAQRMHIRIEPWEGETYPSFCRIERVEEPPDIALGTAGIGVMASSNAGQSVYEGVHYCSLQALCYRVLCSLLPDLVGYRSIYTDSQFGNELPVNAKELIASCIRHRVGKVVFGEKKYSFSESEQMRFLMSSKIAICPAIASVDRQKDQIRVYFKRYRTPVLLSGLEKWVLENVHRYADVRQLHVAGNGEDRLFSVLRRLEEKRLITIYL